MTLSWLLIHRIISFIQKSTLDWIWLKLLIASPKHLLHCLWGWARVVFFFFFFATACVITVLTVAVCASVGCFHCLCLACLTEPRWEREKESERERVRDLWTMCWACFFFQNSVRSVQARGTAVWSRPPKEQLGEQHCVCVWVLRHGRVFTSPHC